MRLCPRQHFHGMVWYGMVWYGVVWCGVVWCGKYGRKYPQHVPAKSIINEMGFQPARKSAGSEPHLKPRLLAPFGFRWLVHMA